MGVDSGYLKPMKYTIHNSHDKKNSKRIHKKHKPSRLQKESYTLPSTYDSNSLLLIPRDPRSIYACWNVDPVKQQRVTSAQIRLYTNTNSNHHETSVLDIDIDFSAGNWYINLPKDNTTCHGELHLKFKNGFTKNIARSNTISTPREQVSAATEFSWVNPDNKKPKPIKNKKPDELRFHEDQKILHENKPYKIDSNNEPISFKSKQKSTEFVEEQLIHSYESPQESFAPSRTEVSAWGPVQMSELQKVIISRAIESSVRNVSSEESNKIYNYLFTGSSEHSISLPNMFIGSSDNRNLQDKNKEFFFEIGAELRLYGRTIPGSIVLLNGDVIETQPDGSFNLRRALPEGVSLLNFKAISPTTLDSREIKTSVWRAPDIFIPG